jgi:hypothetical protein
MYRFSRIILFVLNKQESIFYLIKMSSSMFVVFHATPKHIFRINYRFQVKNTLEKENDYIMESIK